MIERGGNMRKEVAYPHISERILKPGDNLVLVVQTGDARINIRGRNFEVDKATAYFFKVLQVSQLHRKWEGPTLDSGSGSDYNYLGDTGHGTGNDILRIKDDPWIIYHYAIGVAYNHLWVYPMHFNEETCGLEYLVADQPDPTNGDPYGYIPGHEIENFDDPSIQLEGVSWHSDQESTAIHYGFYNNDTIKLKVLLNIRGATYSVHPIADPDIQMKILRREIPALVIPLGSATKRLTMYPPDEWKDAGCSMEITRPIFKEVI